MSNLCSFCVVLLTLMLSSNTKLLASADKQNQNSSAAHNSVSNDNICNNNEKNVAFDVILIENKNLVKRDVPQMSDKRKARARSDQKSLLIIFDGTGSMYDDLQQLRSGAQEIINDLSSRNDSPIFNYVLVVYRDPNVDSPFDTQNPSELLEKLKKIEVSGGGDCPELALNGLRIALQYALPNSLAYVFSDATAKDHAFYEDVVELIQKKQVSINFLLTGDCNAQNSPGYKVYHKLSRVSNGQVYDMHKNNVKDVLLAIRHSVSQNYAALKSLDVESSGTSQTNLNVDKSISELSVRISGKNPTLSIKDPSNETVRNGEELSLENLKLVNIKDPKDGVWRIETGAESAHSVRLSALSNLKFDFGFSAEEITKKSETSFLPLAGSKNVLSIFVSDPKLIQNLNNVSIVLVPSNPLELSLKFTLLLKKINDQVYSTNKFDVPRQMFKIQLNGIDINGNEIERLVSTGLIASYGDPPEVKIESPRSQIYEGENLILKCIASSLIPVEILWNFNGRTLKKISSNQSNELILKINDTKKNHEGSYSCLAVNKLGKDNQNIFVSILNYPKVKIHQDDTEMIENTEYSLSCNVENAVGDYSMSWHGENGKLLQNNSSVYKFIARSSDNKKQISCRISHEAYVMEDSVILQINSLPKFKSEIIFEPNQKISYRESLNLMCVTDQSSTVKTRWLFTNYLNSSRELSASGTELVINEVNEDHEGVYECIVKNKVGEARRKFNIEIMPKAPLTISVNSDILIANETEHVELSCECENCLPITNFSWSFSGNDFRSGQKYDQHSSKNLLTNSFKTFVKISSVTENDGGTFNCHISNKKGSQNATIELLVQSRAKIESIIQNEVEIGEKLEVLEGNKILLECVVDGFPEPEIFWLKDKEKIFNDANLEIANVQELNAGNYECIASNLLGASSKNFDLLINSLPKSKGNQVTSIQARVGQKVEIFCDLMGRPEPQITWKFNGRDIDKNKFKVKNRKLSFDAEECDSGIFNCLGVNEYGRTSIDFTVVVMTHPKIISPNDEYLQIEINSNLTLTCDAIGFPEPQIYFTKNRIKITNGSNYHLDNVSFNDSGIYHCISENEVGSAEKVFYVSTVEKPSIISNFENLTLRTNQTRNIECSASGIPIPRIIWKYQDKSTVSENYILKVTSNSKSGLYTCRAENSIGFDEKSININIINEPTILPSAFNLQTNIRIKEGDDLDLACPFDNFNEILWLLNNNSINIMEHKLIDRKLFIHNINGEHEGMWTCIAINTAGNSSFSYNINVLASPTIFASWNLHGRGISDFLVTESDIDERTFKRGEKLMLNCTSIGLPRPKIIWKKSTDIIGRGEVLTIDNLQFHHSDIYTCTAENIQGSVKKFFKIDVVSPPIIDQDVIIQKKFEKIIGDSIILRCSSIIANPPPLYFWFKDNELLDDESDDHLEIDSLETSHDGKYKCLAKNKYGSAKIDYQISMYEPAKVLTALEEHKILQNDNSLHLSCTSRGNPPPIISWTLNGHVMTTTSKLNLDKLFNASQQDDVIYFNGFGNGITYLDPFEIKLTKQKFYSQLMRIDAKTLKLEMIFKDREKLKNKKFTCYGFNALGRDEKSVEVTINRKPYVKERNKKISDEIEILERLPLLLTCLIDGEPEPKITWYKNGNKVYENETIKFLNDNKFLSIPEAFFWNSGNYSCIGKNSIGKLELKFQVTILAPPKFSDYTIKTIDSRFYNDKAKVIKNNENEEVIYVLKGEDVILECWTQASPEPKIHWIKLNLLDGKKNEVLKENGNVLTLNTIQESSNFLCYANNTIGNVQKIFFIDVQYAPKFIDDKTEERLTVKLNHGLNLECKVKASPEAQISWSYNTTNITRNVNDFYFSSSNQIMRIVSVNKNHEGKFICTATNDHGTAQKVFYVKIEIPIQFSPWSEWSQCSTTCGPHGIQYRSRTCILLDGNPSYNCSGENIQMRKCNDINCPINGAFGNFSKWSPPCPSCYNENSEKPKQKRSRKCDSPLPAYGGLNCEGLIIEERECEIQFCPINGGWSSWDGWSECSKTCGRGTKIRKRYCNNPAPKYNGKMCIGDNVEYEECKIKVCSNFEMRKSFNNEIDYEESTEKFKEFAEFEIIPNDVNQPKIYQFSHHREVEYTVPQKVSSLKSEKLPTVKITLDTYRPISEETYNRHINAINDDDYFEPEFLTSIEFLSTEATTQRRACSRGFKFNSSLNQCEEINECKNRELNNCNADEKCVNTVGSYRCEKKNVRRN